MKLWDVELDDDQLTAEDRAYLAGLPEVLPDSGSGPSSTASGTPWVSITAVRWRTSRRLPRPSTAILSGR